MAYESVKNQIDAYIKANGANLITGPVLNAVLTTMLDELGEGYAFQGVLNTTDTPSPAADIPQAWLASAGTYLGGSITVDEGELALIIHTADGWSKETVYRGVQLSHDAIVTALGYTPADEEDIPSIADNLTTNDPTKALSAAQGVRIKELLDVGFKYLGVAVPSTNPGTPDQNVYYIASTAGTYSNFGGLVLSDGEIAILKYNGAWSKDLTGAASLENVNQLRREIDGLSEFTATGSGWTFVPLSPTIPKGAVITGALLGGVPYTSGTLFFKDADGDQYNVLQNLLPYTAPEDLVTVTLGQTGDITITCEGQGLKQYIDEQDEILDRKISDLETIGDNDKARELGVFVVDKLNSSEIVPNYFLGINFQQVGPYSNWQYLRLSVKPGETYRVSAYAGQAARLWLMMNGNVGVSFSSDSSGTSWKEETITIPNGVDTLIVNARIQNATEINAISILQLVPGINAASVFVEQNKTIKEYVDERTPQDNILYGKILVCAGDSITQGADMDAEGITQDSDIDVYQSDASGNFTELTSNIHMVYGYQIAARNKMTFYNAGISGSTMQGIAERNGFSLANGRYTKLPDNIDYLTIFFGWNDTAYGTLGTIDDVTNETYYGGYNVVMPYLINKYPFAKIALIVPFGTDVGHRNAIRELADKWGVACFDMYQGGTPLYFGKEPSVNVDSAIVTSNRAKFQANGAHPNYKGHRQIGDMLEHFLRGI